MGTKIKDVELGFNKKGFSIKTGNDNLNVGLSKEYSGEIKGGLNYRIDF